MGVALTCPPGPFQTIPQQKKVSGTWCQGIHPDSHVQVRGVATVRSEKITFQAGMYMKRRGPEYGVWSLKTSATERLF